MDSLVGFDFEMNMGTGYFLCTNDEYRKKCGYDFCTIYHQIICNEIKKDNILNVNGLIRWIDHCGYFPNNKLLFTYTLEHGTIKMFMMIYYICLYWGNEGENDKKYVINALDYFNRMKETITATYLTVNDANLVPKEVVLLMMYDLLCTNIVDYDYKISMLNNIHKKFGNLPWYDEKLDDDVFEEYYDNFEDYLQIMLKSYDINMTQINEEFYNKYGEEYEEMAW